MEEADRDTAVRLAALRFVREQRLIHGDELPRRVLEQGFPFDGRRVPLVGPQGIFKPAVLQLPLSITTAPPVEGRPPPYEDAIDESGLITYRYRGIDPEHRDNVGLRETMRRQVPLFYFFGTERGWYQAVYPVFVVGEAPGQNAFMVQAEDAWAAGDAPLGADDPRRRYITRQVQQRIHQAQFRTKVIRAYRTRCAVCSLHDHRELLDAAHILPDGHPEGAPVLPNGLSLCKLHHAAYDANLIGVRPDYEIEVQRRVLDETDGPMLLHGLQGMNGRRLIVPGRPEQRPDPRYLEERYELFRMAS